MKLYLLRHAEPELFAASGKDFDRRLTFKGEYQVRELGERVRLFPDIKDLSVYCSTAKRTEETYQILREYLPLGIIEYREDLYLASFQYLIDFCRNIEDDSSTIMLIGHNFGLSELGSYLLGETILLPPCGLLEIDLPTGFPLL